MPVACVSAALFYSVVVDVSAWVLTTSSPADPPLLSPRHYQHTDPDSGAALLCDKCPAGTYVSAHCSPAAVRECSPCPDGTFTRGENGVGQCHQCRAPCPSGLIEKAACAATQDRVCACPPDSFLSGGARCKPHSPCPPGTRVKRRGTDTEDVLCKPCTKGTFSRRGSGATKCQTHTNCEAQGLLLLTPGTRVTDNVCGPLPTSPDTPPPLSVSAATSGGALQEPGTPFSSASPTVTEGLRSQSAAAPLQPSRLIGRLATPSPQTPDPVLAPSQQNMEGLDGAEAGVGRGAGQGGGVRVSTNYRPIRRGSPRPSPPNGFDINEHLPWMTVLLLLLVLVVIVGVSVKRSSRVLKKGPAQDPSSIVEKAVPKRASAPPTHSRDKWIYYTNSQGVDILKLVAAHVGTQWIDIYQSLANATEREVAAFSNGYASDGERAYAALQHWTIRDGDANLAKLISALHRQRRIDVVEKIRCVMEDEPQFDINQLMTSVNVSQSLSPIHKPLESPSSLGSGGGGSVGGASGASADRSPVDRAKGFFPDESEPLLRCDSTSSKDSGLSRNGSFITKERKDTVLRQVRLDPCHLQPIFDDMLHILNPEELLVIEGTPAAEDKLDRLFEIAGVKSQEASQTLLDSVYSHLPDLL